jgi:TrmH family RNA methyltransferase
MKHVIQTYKKESPHSYTAGAYATIELLKTRPEMAEAVYVHSTYRDAEGLARLCHDAGIPICFDDSAFKRINQKENTYAVGLFAKYAGRLSPRAPHVVLVNPADMGNLGTIIRTLAGYNLTNLAVITPAADVWHPKTIRASMGAVFHMEIEQFASFERYRERHPAHMLYPFMLDGELPLSCGSCPRDELYSLIFGNEASGLPASYREIGTSVRLSQSTLVDSLNLSVAVGVGAFLFASANGQI